MGRRALRTGDLVRCKNYPLVMHFEPTTFAVLQERFTFGLYLGGLITNGNLGVHVSWALVLDSQSNRFGWVHRSKGRLVKVD